MNIFIIKHSGEDPRVVKGVEEFIVEMVNNHGPITSLDQWAHEWELAPWWVRLCVLRAAAKGLVKLERLEHNVGRPYQVSSLEEEK